ncbi:MAG: hypothetical protein JSS02_08105 [Planctomycetes bacterium]|nr:hypothetical protein [Planctomycetota bacterium]
MEKDPKIAVQPVGLRVLIALHIAAVVVVGVGSLLDSHGILAPPVAGWQVAVFQLVLVPALLSVFVFPLAVLAAADRCGFRRDTASAVLAEVLLVIAHVFAALPLYQ